MDDTSRVRSGADPVALQRPMRRNDLRRMGKPIGDAGSETEDTSASVRHRLAALARQHGLRDVYVFGSRAAEIAARVRGSAEPSRRHPTSDVDIAIRPACGSYFDVDARVDVALALEALLGASRVDLVVLPEAGASLALAAVSGGPLYCDDATDQAEYELYVLRRAGDLLPFERVRRALILKHGAR